MALLPMMFLSRLLELSHVARQRLFASPATINREVRSRLTKEGEAPPVVGLTFKDRRFRGGGIDGDWRLTLADVGIEDGDVLDVTVEPPPASCTLCQKGEDVDEDGMPSCDCQLHRLECCRKRLCSECEFHTRPAHSTRATTRERWHAPALRATAVGADASAVAFAALPKASCARSMLAPAAARDFHA